MSSPWPPAALPGLVVDFGLYDPEAPSGCRWVREPSASFRCVCGYRRTACGAGGVTELDYAASAHQGHCRHHTTGRAA